MGHKHPFSLDLMYRTQFNLIITIIALGGVVVTPQRPMKCRELFAPVQNHLRLLSIWNPCVYLYFFIAFIHAGGCHSPVRIPCHLAVCSSQLRD